jgi:hypothetical protein
MNRWPMLWFLASAIGVIGLTATLAAVILLGYAAISHVGSPDKQVPWHWQAGIVPIALRGLLGGIFLQALAFASRLSMNGS